MLNIEEMKTDTTETEYFQISKRIYGAISKIWKYLYDKVEGGENVGTWRTKNKSKIEEFYRYF